jgi:hypothetical protein
MARTGGRAVLENVPPTLPAPLGTFSRGAPPGNGLPDKRATATEQAVETPGGGRDRLSSSNAPRHRRAASRSGGATSAERDGRPVFRRTSPETATDFEPSDPGDSSSPPRTPHRLKRQLNAPTDTPLRNRLQHTVSSLFTDI